MDALLYLVYGGGPHLDEVVYAVLSARKILGPRSHDCAIVIYTDDAASPLRRLPVDLKPVGRALLAEWMGRSRFDHRAKICAIRDALREWGNRIVYLDSDTYFLKDPRELFARIRPGASLMHVCEGPLNESRGPGLVQFLGNTELRTVKGKRWNRVEDVLMFNAGVIGMHRDNIDLLDEVLHLTDQIYPQVKAHTVEQFAFSVCLSQRTKLRQACDAVCHYWPMPGRAQFREELRRVLRDPSISAAEEERWQRLAQHRPVPNIVPFRRSFKDRLRSTLRRGAKRAGVLEPVRFVMHKLRGSDAE